MDGKIEYPNWWPSDTAAVIRILKKFRNLRKLVVSSDEVGGEATNAFLRGIWELQHEDCRNIQSLLFSGAALLSPVFPRMIELCSTSLTSLSLDWGSVRDPNSALSVSLGFNDNGNSGVHPAVGPIARAVRLCRNLQRFQSAESPNGIGQVFRELSDKLKLELVDLQVPLYMESDEEFHDVPAEMPEHW